jgi:hypothetical protein
MQNAIDLGTAVWRKSSRSNGNGGNNCVAVAFLTDGVTAVRDTKNPSGPALVFTRSEWDAFLGGVKDGEFDNVE